MVAIATLAIVGGFAPAAHADPSVSELTKQIDKASNQLQTVVESYNEMRIALQKTSTQEKQLAASLGPAKASLQTAQVQLQEVAARSYMQGKVGPMSALLSSTNDVMDRMSLLEQLSYSRQRDIQSYTELFQTYSQRQAALKAAQAKQAAQVTALAARKTKIEADIRKLRQMRTAAYGTPTETVKKYTGSVPAISGSAGVAVRFAYAQIGKSYSFGADGPNSYDCSGLTMASWAAAGKSLPHSARQQYGVTTRISRSQLAPGDLVFYNYLGHVGIYVGGGYIIDAPTYGKPVDKRPIDRGMPIDGYGRV